MSQGEMCCRDFIITIINVPKLNPTRLHVPLHLWATFMHKNVIKENLTLQSFRPCCLKPEGQNRKEAKQMKLDARKHLQHNSIRWLRRCDSHRDNIIACSRWCSTVGCKRRWYWTATSIETPKEQLKWDLPELSVAVPTYDNKTANLSDWEISRGQLYLCQSTAVPFNYTESSHL